MAKKSRRKISVEAGSLSPGQTYCIQKKRGRAYLDAALYSKTTFADFLSDPNLYLWWYERTLKERQIVLDYIKRKFGVEAWKRFKREIQREANRFRSETKIAHGDAIALAEIEKLHQKVRVVTVVPKDFVTNSIIAYVKMGFKPDALARMFDLPEETITNICTPEAMAEVKGDYFLTVVKELRMQLLLMLAARVAKGELKSGEILPALRFLESYEKKADKGDFPCLTSGETLEDRHREYCKLTQAKKMQDDTDRPNL